MRSRVAASRDRLASNTRPPATSAEAIRNQHEGYHSKKCVIPREESQPLLRNRGDPAGLVPPAGRRRSHERSRSSSHANQNPKMPRVLKRAAQTRYDNCSDDPDR